MIDELISILSMCVDVPSLPTISEERPTSHRCGRCADLTTTATGSSYGDVQLGHASVLSSSAPFYASRPLMRGNQPQAFQFGVSNDLAVACRLYAPFFHGLS